MSSIRLPLRALAYLDRRADYTQLHDVPGLINDSLPDGWGYRLLHHRMKGRGIHPDKVSTLDRLAYLGVVHHGAGATLRPDRLPGLLGRAHVLQTAKAAGMSVAVATVHSAMRVNYARLVQ